MQEPIPQSVEVRYSAGNEQEHTVTLPVQSDGNFACGGFMSKWISALLLCLLAGCGTAPPRGGGYDVCQTAPGSFDCQVLRYQNAF
ncbi:MAG: hypothetical protein ABWZ88_19075 [Variovorax sp.]